MKSKLSELFDGGTDYTWTSDSPNLAIAKFAVEENQYTATFELVDSMSERWYIDFSLRKKGSNFPEYGIAKTGKSVSVMSAMVGIIGEFLNKHKPSVIVFSAEEPSRSSLYRRMAQKLLPAWTETIDKSKLIYTSPDAIKNPWDDINEAKINPADAKEAFKVASGLRNNSTGLSRIFKGLRKDKIDVNDLQQAWKDEGFPSDTTEIAAILKGHGFSPTEINKVYSEVFGKGTGKNDFEEPVASDAIQKIATYAKNNGLVDELKLFLQKEYGFTESLTYEGKAVMEDIRQIFTSIVREPRADRNSMIKIQEQTQLGRIKK
jgi:hypothetical protein